MLDIHTHLFWDSYDSDREAVIARAREAGVRQMICVGTSPEDNPQAIAVAEHYPNIWAAVGIHPHYFDELGIKNQELREKASIHNSQFTIPSEEKEQIKELMEDLRAVASHSKVIAIGECGLDYFVRGEEQPITDEQKIFQKEGFLAQLELAQVLSLPVIIHTRPSAGTMDAYEDLFEILHDTKYMIHNTNTILHCYQGDTEITSKFLELPHVYFSFSGSITYPMKKSLIGTKDDSTETVKLVPLERLFIETDCPFLAPQTKRGTRNEPAYVSFVADAICRLQECSLPDFKKHLAENWEKVFGASTGR